MMGRLLAVVLAAAIGASATIAAQGKIKQHGRAVVEYHSEDVLAVASYDYSQRNHEGAWLLIEFAVQAMHRIVIHRNELTLMGPGERAFPIATQEQFLDDQMVLKPLYQNAIVTRHPLSTYFSKRPIMQTVQFFAFPGSLKTDSAVTNPDEVAAGDLLFKSPDGKWMSGMYRLVLSHEKAKAELPIDLK